MDMNINKEMRETRDAIARKYPVAYIHMYLQRSADPYDDDPRKRAHYERYYKRVDPDG